MMKSLKMINCINLVIIVWDWEPVLHLPRMGFSPKKNCPGQASTVKQVETKVIDRSLQDKKARKRSRDELSKDHWLIPNTRVRIISHKVERNYYKQKALVLDTVGTLTMEGHISEKGKDKYLETALPKIGRVVVILAGKQKYQHGHSLSRDTRKGKNQLLDDHNVLNVSLDNIAEWCGNLDFD